MHYYDYSNIPEEQIRNEVIGDLKMTCDNAYKTWKHPKDLCEQIDRLLRLEIQIGRYLLFKEGVELTDPYYLN